MFVEKVRPHSKRELVELLRLPHQGMQGLFDIDGVFSAPHRGQAKADVALTTQLAGAISLGLTASFATGRPGIWISADDGVAGLVRAGLTDKPEALGRFFQAAHFAENGAVKLSWDPKKGSYAEVVVDEELRFSKDFLQLARQLVTDRGIGHFASVDEAKRCVLSIFVSSEGFGEADLSPHKDFIANQFRDFIRKKELNWTVAQTAIAVDAYDPRATKELAVEGFLGSLKLPGTQPDLALFAVGDSPSDFAMFTGLLRARDEGRLPKSANLFFVFTGTEKALSDLQNKYQVDFSKTPGLIYAGVVGATDKVEIYSDATKLFFDKMLQEG